MKILREWIDNKKLIFELAKNDFSMRFAGSFFGVVWAFVQPVVTVLLYVFVFQSIILLFQGFSPDANAFLLTMDVSP